MAISPCAPPLALVGVPSPSADDAPASTRTVLSALRPLTFARDGAGRTHDVSAAVASAERTDSYGVSGRTGKITSSGFFPLTLSSFGRNARDGERSYRVGVS